MFGNPMAENTDTHQFVSVPEADQRDPDGKNPALLVAVVNLDPSPAGLAYTVVSGRTGEGGMPNPSFGFMAE